MKRKPEIYFCRSYSFQTELGNQARFFVLKVKACGEVDPKSGMAVDLVDLDQKVHETTLQVRGTNELSFVDEIFQELNKKGISIHEIELEDPALMRSWGRVMESVWQTSQSWVRLLANRKMYLLKIKTSEAQMPILPNQFAALIEAQNYLDQQKLLQWSLEEPVMESLLSS